MTYKEYREQIRKSIERMQLVELEVKSRIVINDKEIKQYYETHKDEFRTGEKIRLAAIFLNLKNKGDPNEMKELLRKAQVIISRLNAGQDFAELAEQFSEGPGADNGGDLGYFEPKELDPKLRKIVEHMKVGDVRGPIIRPFGIQIIKLLDRKKAGIKPLKEVKDYIYRILYNKEINKRYTSWINELKQKSYIKIMF
jgi:peptidyl-prolyl cis-trans isomerase SurA